MSKPGQLCRMQNWCICFLLQKIQLWRMMIYRSWLFFSCGKLSRGKVSGFLFMPRKWAVFEKQMMCKPLQYCCFSDSEWQNARARCENGWSMSISNELKKGLLRVEVLRDIWCLWELATTKQKLRGKFVMGPMLNRCNYVLCILIFGAAGIAVYIYIYVSIQTNYDNSQPQIQPIFWKVTSTTSIQMRSINRWTNKGLPRFTGGPPGWHPTPAIYTGSSCSNPSNWRVQDPCGQGGKSTSTNPFGMLYLVIQVSWNK